MRDDIYCVSKGEEDEKRMYSILENNRQGQKVLNSCFLIWIFV